MALSPIQPDDGRQLETAAEPEPSATYQLNTDSLTIGGIIDGEQALRQAILKAVTTARYRFLIYDDQYGSELDELIGQDATMEFLEMEIPRIVREALIYDDRFDDVTNVTINRDSDKLYVSFTVVTADGVLIDEEVVF
jgi:phage baseplate assembly protein W